MQLKTILRQVPDPRGKQGQDYMLWSILSLIVVSLLCGRRGMKAAFLLGRSLSRRQRAELGFIRGTTPCHATLTETLRVEAQAPPKSERHHLVTSDRLYALGIELMDIAIAGANALGNTTKAQALQYRDGLIIALLALIPLRRRTLAALRVGKQLVRSGQLWALEIPAEDTKTRCELDYEVSPELSERIDVYLSIIRCRIPGADNGLWASDQGRKMDHGSIYAAVCKRMVICVGLVRSVTR